MNSKTLRENRGIHGRHDDVLSRVGQRSRDVQASNLSGKVGLTSHVILIRNGERHHEILFAMGHRLLKDAAATSIYGSRGANGVVIIKTKQ